MSEKSEQAVRQAIEKFVEMFEDNSFPEMIARTMLKRRHNSRPSDGWSIFNQLLQALAGTTDGRTYKEWQKVGRQVVKGSDAFYIWRPIKKTIYYTDEETGETAKTRITLGFQPTPRFRIEDTEGEPVEYPSYEPTELPPLHEVAANMGVSVEYMPARSSAYGYCTVDATAIGLCTHDEAVFWHEIAHAADKQVQGKLKGGQHKDQEIVAETVAAVLCVMYGREGYLRNCGNYIRRYAKEEAPEKAIMRLMNRIQDALDVIFEYSEDREMVPA